MSRFNHPRILESNNIESKKGSDSHPIHEQFVAKTKAFSLSNIQHSDTIILSLHQTLAVLITDTRVANIRRPTAGLTAMLEVHRDPRHRGDTTVSVRHDGERLRSSSGTTNATDGSGVARSHALRVVEARYAEPVDDAVERGPHRRRGVDEHGLRRGRR